MSNPKILFEECSDLISTQIHRVRKGAALAEAGDAIVAIRAAVVVVVQCLVRKIT